MNTRDAEGHSAPSIARGIYPSLGFGGPGRIRGEPSRTIRTFRARLSGVIGFCRKATPESSKP